MAKFVRQLGKKHASVHTEKHEIDRFDLHHDLKREQGVLITNASQIPERLLKFQTTTPLWEQERHMDPLAHNPQILRADRKTTVEYDEDLDRAIDLNEEGTLAPGLPGVSNIERLIPFYSVRHPSVENVMRLHGKKIQVRTEDIPFIQGLPYETARFLEPSITIGGRHADDRDEESEFQREMRLRRTLFRENALDDSESSSEDSGSESSESETETETEPEEPVPELQPDPFELIIEPEPEGEEEEEFHEEPEPEAEEVASIKSESVHEEEHVPTPPKPPTPVHHVEEEKPKPVEKETPPPCKDTGKYWFDMSKCNDYVEEARELLFGNLIQKKPCPPPPPKRKPIRIVLPPLAQPPPTPPPPPSPPPPPEPPKQPAKNCGCGMKNCGCECNCRCNCSNNNNSHVEHECFQAPEMSTITITDVNNNPVQVPKSQVAEKDKGTSATKLDLLKPAPSPISMIVREKSPPKYDDIFKPHNPPPPSNEKNPTPSANYPIPSILKEITRTLVSPQIPPHIPPTPTVVQKMEFATTKPMTDIYRHKDVNGNLPPSALKTQFDGPNKRVTLNIKTSSNVNGGVSTPNNKRSSAAGSKSTSNNSKLPPPPPPPSQKRRSSSSNKSGKCGTEKSRSRSRKKSSCSSCCCQDPCCFCCESSSESEEESHRPGDAFPSEFLWFLLQLNTTSNFYRYQASYAATYYASLENEKQLAKKKANVSRINVDCLEEVLCREGEQALKNKEVSITLRPFEHAHENCIPANPLVDLNALKFFAHGEKETECCCGGAKNEGENECEGGEGGDKEEKEEECCPVSPPKPQTPPPPPPPPPPPHPPQPTLHQIQQIQFQILQQILDPQDDQQQQQRPGIPSYQINIPSPQKPKEPAPACMPPPGYPCGGFPPPMASPFPPPYGFPPGMPPPPSQFPYPPPYGYPSPPPPPGFPPGMPPPYHPGMMPPPFPPGMMPPPCFPGMPPQYSPGMPPQHPQGMPSQYSPGMMPQQYPQRMSQQFSPRTSFQSGMPPQYPPPNMAPPQYSPRNSFQSEMPPGGNKWNNNFDNNNNDCNNEYTNNGQAVRNSFGTKGDRSRRRNSGATPTAKRTSGSSGNKKKNVAQSNNNNNNNYYTTGTDKNAARKSHHRPSKDSASRRQRQGQPPGQTTSNINIKFVRGPGKKK